MITRTDARQVMEIPRGGANFFFFFFYSWRSVLDQCESVMRLQSVKLLKLKLLLEETVLPPCPVNTSLPKPVPPPSDIDLVHHATQLALWLHDDQNNEVSDPITSFSGSHLRPTPRPGSACSRLEAGAELEGWRYHLHQGQPELGMKCQSCTPGFADPKLRDSHSRNLRMLPVTGKYSVGRAGQGHGKRANGDGQGCDASL